MGYHSPLVQKLDTIPQYFFLLIDRGVKNGEVYSVMGKAYRELSKQSGNEGRQEKSTEYLTQSYEAYLQGYLTDFEFHPGINAVYHLHFLGRNTEAEKLAQMVYASTEVAGGLQSRDYWCLTTMLALACITKKPGTEIDKVLGQVVKYARSKDEIAGSTLPMIRSLREQRSSTQEQVDELDRVIATLEKRAIQLEWGNGEADKLPIGELQTPETQLLKFFYNYLGQAEGPVSHFIGGNIEWNGQLHAEVINRSDIKKAKALITQLGLDGNTDVRVFSQIVDSLIRRQFGTPGLEDLHSPEHQVYDRTVKGLLEFANGQATGGHTNIMVDLEMGLGDCRHHAYAKQLLFDTWKRNNINMELNKAYIALTQQNDETEFNRILNGSVPELQGTQMYVYDMSVRAPIQIEEKYHPVEQNGKWVADATGEVKTVEDHTANVLVTHDPEKGYMITFADGFYQDKHYRWGYHQQSAESAVPLSFVVENGYLPAGKIQVVNPSSGELTQVDVQGYPSRYAGARQRQIYDNFGGDLVRGIPTESTPEKLIRNLGLTNEPPSGNIIELKQKVQTLVA